MIQGRRRLSGGWRYHRRRNTDTRRIVVANFAMDLTKAMSLRSIVSRDLKAYHTAVCISKTLTFSTWKRTFPELH